MRATSTWAGTPEPAGSVHDDIPSSMTLCTCRATGRLLSLDACQSVAAGRLAHPKAHTQRLQAYTKS